MALLRPVGRSSSATARPSCRLLGRTVVLADGGTGADALAAGWWTSFWQVPVLLTAPDGTLPPATRAALQATAINNRRRARRHRRASPDAVLAEAQCAHRSGRSCGSRAPIATRPQWRWPRRLGGWWPTGDAADSAGSLVCLAASGGQGSNSVGWPDALGAGPFCGAINGGSLEPGSSDSRAAAGRWRGAVGRRSGARPARDAVPVLLVAPQSSALPAATSDLPRVGLPDWRTGARARRRCPRAPRPASPSRSVGVPSLPTKRCTTPRRSSPAAPTRWPTTSRRRLAAGFTTGLDLSPVFAAAEAAAARTANASLAARCWRCDGCRCSATVRRRSSTASST